MEQSQSKRMMPVKIFSSFEDENKAEHQRLASMTPAQRLQEFAILQKRAWGKKWTSDPIVKIATYEKIPWL